MPITNANDNCDCGFALKTRTRTLNTNTMPKQIIGQKTVFFCKSKEKLTKSLISANKKQKHSWSQQILLLYY